MKSTKVKTKNILNSLKKYAKANAISLDAVDFKILKVESKIRTIHEKDYFHYNENIQTYYDSDEKTINEHVEFKQIYVIEMFQQIGCEIMLDYKIEYNEFKTKVNIIISKDSIIPSKHYKIKDLYRLITSEVNKIKAKEGILLNLYDKAYIHQLKAFTKHLGADKFHKNIKLPLFRGIDPSVTKKSQLIKYYEDKKNEYGISEVEAGEIIIEYIKPKFGLNGLDAFGDIVDATAFSNIKDTTKEIDSETIKIEENEDNKLYIAKVKGFVSLADDKLSIDNKIKLKKISRVQKQVADDENNNIEVILKEHDSTKDGIGEGVELTSETIHVEGFVGSNSFLNATNLIIDGATHQTSNQSAKYAKINRHKGNLRCHEAEIKLLEGGEIHATNVNIDSCLGGTIYAKHVTIKHVKKNVKIYASHSINIDQVSGEENVFTIDPRAIPILEKKLEFINADIEDLKFDLEEAQRHEQNKVPGIEQKIQNLVNTKNSIYDSVYDASINIVKPIRGFNTIVFTLKDNKKLTYKTKAQKYTKFFLVSSNDVVTLNPTTVSINLA